MAAPAAKATGGGLMAEPAWGAGVEPGRAAVEPRGGRAVGKGQAMAPAWGATVAAGAGVAGEVSRVGEEVGARRRRRRLGAGRGRGGGGAKYQTASHWPDGAATPAAARAQAARGNAATALGRSAPQGTPTSAAVAFSRGRGGKRGAGAGAVRTGLVAEVLKASTVGRFGRPAEAHAGEKRHHACNVESVGRASADLGNLVVLRCQCYRPGGGDTSEVAANAAATRSPAAGHAASASGAAAGAAALRTHCCRRPPTRRLEGGRGRSETSALRPSPSCRRSGAGRGRL
mmetsp:Transcript_53054/g.116107  ORF Transcript_53054/g.116107 Transcript_53054/m.116107 type:complete len:287 (-) Transcript_53054:281-1141(-)